MIGVNIDIGDLTDLLNMEERLNASLNDAARNLAGAIHERCVELAEQKLHARRQLYVENLSMFPEEGGVWVVSLAAKARWIDDGQDPFNMLDGLLASKHAKRSKKDDSTYVVVPFKHGPGMGPGTTTPAQQNLISTIRSELKKRKIPFGDIEKDSAGQPLMGKLHSFDILNKPIKKAEGPGQGKGPIGEVKQGPTGIPFLQHVSIHQGRDPKGAVKRSVMTFRTASSKHKGQGRWEHPGNDPVNIMDEAAKWGIEQFEKEIAPALLQKLLVEMSG